jgi:hypothetical protein
MSKVIRHDATEGETTILASCIETYFQYPKRSPERKQILGTAAEVLWNIGSREWKDREVQIWFCNNRSKYCPDYVNRKDSFPIPRAASATDSFDRSSGKDDP